MQWCNRSRVWREAAPAAEHTVQGEALNRLLWPPPGHPKMLDHMPWFSFTHAMNPGMQDALRALQNTNQSVANADNSEICFRSALLIQTKLLAGKARELPNYRAQLSDLLARWTPLCFQGALLPTLLSHLGVWKLLLPTSAANKTQERKAKQLLCQVVWGLQVVPAPPPAWPHRSRRAPAPSLSLEIHP